MPLFGLWNRGFHDCVGIRKALKAVSQVLDGRVGGYRQGSPCYSYHAGSAGLVDGTGYPICSWGMIFGHESPDNFARDVLCKQSTTISRNWGLSNRKEAQYGKDSCTSCLMHKTRSCARTSHQGRVRKVVVAVNRTRWKKLSKDWTDLNKYWWDTVR